MILTAGLIDVEGKIEVFVLLIVTTGILNNEVHESVASYFA